MRLLATFAVMLFVGHAHGQDWTEADVELYRNATVVRVNNCVDRYEAVRKMSVDVLGDYVVAKALQANANWLWGSLVYGFQQAADDEGLVGTTIGACKERYLTAEADRALGYEKMMEGLALFIEAEELQGKKDWQAAGPKFVEASGKVLGAYAILGGAFDAQLINMDNLGIVMQVLWKYQ